MTTAPPRSLRSRISRGYSLLELLITIAIVGTMAALVMPRVRLDNSQVDTAARSFGMALMVAQRDAASRQHNVLLVFDTTAHFIRTVWDVNNNARFDSDEKSRLFLLPERVVLGRPSSVGALGTATASIPEMLTSNSSPMLVLQRNGSVDRSVTIYLSTISAMAGGTDKDTRAVVISRATARPEWYAWGSTEWRHGR
ncbi:Tfp pilus assembly protein FimT/FimU [Gemmatimonas sp.]|uniref:Tfp pilus assembly protein FimT/FimU n=1 Tax=Gemmatimonas sp. TaxID=1962908 RepID=UPI0037BF14C2